MPNDLASHPPYSSEYDGQLDFFRQFGIDAGDALIHNTDGVHKGNLLEFKLNISNLNATLFQAVKYLAKLRIRGVDVPAHILLVDLNRRSAYRFASAEYDGAIHQSYYTAASRQNDGFQWVSAPEVVENYLSPTGARTVKQWLSETAVHPIRINADCVVAWAERYYREVPGSSKSSLLSAAGELRRPSQFAGKIVPYEGDTNAAFARILDRLNDKLKKIELGAFYTPDPYVEKALDLVREAIARVPEGNDYVIIDRCAGTGNLQRHFTDEELSHVIVNTFEEFEYLELAREFGDRVREVIPPTYDSGDPNPALGVLRNGDALTESFVRGEAGAAIRQYVDDPNCTIIMFENPPYAEVASIEAHAKKGQVSFGWKNSWVRSEMATALKARTDIPEGVKVTNDLANVFIWSAFEYYLRQPTDSYVVFSPCKYFKSQNLIPDKRFVKGFLFNRKHFHAKTPAGVSVILWSNEAAPKRSTYPLDVFDIDGAGQLVAGSAKLAVGQSAPKKTVVETTSKMLSSLYAPLPADLESTKGIVCEKNGYEAHRKTSGITPVNAESIIGYLVSKSFSFENADLMTQLTRCGAYDGHGFYLTKSNYLAKLPLFVVGRHPAGKRWWERGVVNRCADNGDNFSKDADFLRACLIYTALSRHNKCLSFTGSDGVFYRNELCLDDGTLATQYLAGETLAPVEEALLEQWRRVLAQAQKTANYEPDLSYGLYQIDIELNTRRREAKAGSKKEITVYDYPGLRGDIETLKTMVAAYHAEVITPKLWSFGLLK